MKQFFILLLCSLSFLTKSQITETFPSTYITASNAWKGDTSLYYITQDGWLQLDDIYEQGNASVQLPVTYTKNMEWELDVQLYCNSSNANNARIYVISSGKDTDPDETHYYIQVGHNDDNISLYSVKGSGTAKRLIKGRMDLLDKEEVNVRVKLLLANGDTWKLYSRLAGEPAFIHEGDTTIKQLSIPPSGIFKLNCRYSKTRSYHFAFDNIRVSGDSSVIADTTPPSISQIETVSDSTLLFTFSEAVRISSASCTIENKGDAALEADSTSATKVLVHTPGVLESGKEYTLCLDNITDLAGNLLEDACLSFTFTKDDSPEEPEEENPVEEEPDASADITFREIIFNEILPDPRTGGSEYIELYNRSGKSLSVAKLAIATRKTEGTLSTLYPLSELALSMEKEDFLVVSKDKNGVHSQYASPNPEKVHSVKLPVLANTSSTLVLINTETEEVIDELSYNSKWHSAFVTDSKGIALERIDPEAATQSSENWASAAAEEGHGTPGYLNTQFGVIKNGPVVGIDTPVLAPGGDAYTIAYQADQSGYSCRIFIFDPAGRQVARVQNNELIGQQGTLRWDGKGTGGEKLPTGLYILYAEIYHPSGALHKFKKVFSVR